MRAVFRPLILVAACVAVVPLANGADSNAAKEPTPKDTPASKEPLPPPPIPKNYKPPETDPTTEELQPEVRITTKGDEIHQEYRINGRLYMIKVTPALGPPYYLIDQEGSGNFVQSGIQPEVNPPMWVIKEF